MGSDGAPKRVRHIAAELPDDPARKIFSKLDFKSKVVAGQVCKKWDQLLKGPIAGDRHWDVYYNLDTIVSKQAFSATEQVPIVEQFNVTIGRWLVNRAAAIETVHVSATLSSDQKGVATMNVLESQLPLLAGCLAKHGKMLKLTFYEGTPFASPVLSSSAFLTFLSPMVRTLDLCSLEVPIDTRQFAAICELSSLESLSIDREQFGLQEMTSDISKLVNLTSLCLDKNWLLKYIPESISCLQKLQFLNISGSYISELPSGLAKLANLECLCILTCVPLRWPRSLQGLKSLTSVDLSDCALKKIPEVLTGLSGLTSLELSSTYLHSSNGSWLPTTLSRLTNLVELVIYCSAVVSLPPHISGLRQLTKLDVRWNELRSLPEQLSSLQNLRKLQADENYLRTVPVSVLSSLTALTSIGLGDQRFGIIPTFKVSSPLLPILHPGLVELNLRQHAQWDPLSLRHLECAMAELAGRTPVPRFQYLPLSFW